MRINADGAEVADAVTWLCSNAARLVNGAILPVDGGDTSRLCCQPFQSPNLSPTVSRRPLKSLVVLFRFTSERFGRESRKPSEERFGERFLFFGRKFQVLLDFRFQVLKFFRECD